MSKIVAETSHFEGGDMTWTNRRGDAGKETVGGISRVHWPKEEVWRWPSQMRADLPDFQAMASSCVGRKQMPTDIGWTDETWREMPDEY